MKMKPTPAGAVLAALALVISLALVPAALAGKGKPPTGGGGGSTSGSISLVMVHDLNGNGLPNVGDTITFAVSTSATSSPYVTVNCFQNGTLVYTQSSGIFPASLNQLFILGGTTAWANGGAASCTAYLQAWNGKGGFTNLNSMNFFVGA
jgi:hypothetical protein